MRALNLGDQHSAPRSLVLEMLRLAAEPTSSTRGLAWASAWSGNGQRISASEFHHICSALEHMITSGVPPTSQSAPEPSSTATCDRVSAGVGIAGVGGRAEPPPKDPWATAATAPSPLSAVALAPLQERSGWEETREPEAAPPYNDVEGEQYRKLFVSMTNGAGRASRQQVSMTMSRAKLPQGDVDVILSLCDLDDDGKLDEEEVLIALHLAASRYKGGALPSSLPSTWLSAAKRSLVPDETSIGSFDGDIDGDAPSSVGGSSDDLQVQSKQRRGGLFGRRSAPREPKLKKGGKAMTDAPGTSGSWPPSGDEPSAERDGFGGTAQLPSSTFQFGDPTQKISISFGQTKQVTHIEDTPLVNPNIVARSGALITTAGGKHKLRWVVLGAGQLAVYSDKKEAASAKPPKCILDMRADVSRVVCNSMGSFSIALARDIRDARDKGGKAKAMHKAGDNLSFSMEDSKELTAWVNDLTNVWRALRAGP